MRAFSASATMMRAMSASPSETRNPTAGEAMNAAIVESCVDPAISARVNTTIDHRRFGERGDHHLPARADAAEARADIHAGERQEEARAGEKGDDGDEIGGPAEEEAGGEARHESGRHPGRGKDQIGRGAEEPARVLGQHHLLAREPQEIAIGLDDRRAATAQKACFRPCARARRAPAPAAGPAAFAVLGWRDRRSKP